MALVRPKLFYVLPEYSGHQTSRFYYIWEFLESLSKTVDVFLFIEKGGQKNLSVKFSVYQQKFHFFPLNVIERLLIFSALRIKGYDNFYVHYSIFSSLLVALISGLTGGRSFYWYCQMYHLYPHVWWEKIAFKLNLKLITNLLTGNEGMKKYFWDNFRVPLTKSISFPLWINSSRFRYSPKEKLALKREFGIENSKIVLFVHGLSPRKGADKIIPVAQKVCKKVKNVVFLVVGDGEMLESLKDQVKTEKLSSLVRIVGPVGNVDIPKYYAVADVFFMPSKEEKFGRVLLETMVAGVPVVATDTLGPRTIMTSFQKKYLGKYPNINDFSKKIVKILIDKKTWWHLSTDGLSVAANFELLKISKTFSDLLVKPIKLCYVLSEYDENISSHYRHIYELLEEVGKKISVYLFLEKSKALSLKIANLEGIYIQKYNNYPILNLIERFFIMFKLRLSGYDKFYTHYSIFSSIVAALVCRITGAKSFYWHCQSRHKYERKLEFSWNSLSWKVTQDWSFRFNLKLISYLATATYEMGDYYSKHFNIAREKVLYFPLWVNINRFHYCRVSDIKLTRQYHLWRKKVVLFIHWLSERKGADKIVFVAQKVIAKIPKAVFLVVGGGPLQNSLVKQAKSFGLEKKIIFTGPVPNDEVPQYYCPADVFFMPITENGFGRVLLEAMACKLPAVASDTLGPLELFTGLQRKYLVNPNDINAFASAIVKILSDETLRKKLSVENWKLVQQYTLSLAVKNFVRLVS